MRQELIFGYNRSPARPIAARMNRERTCSRASIRCAGGIARIVRKAAFKKRAPRPAPLVEEELCEPAALDHHAQRALERVARDVGRLPIAPHAHRMFPAGVGAQTAADTSILVDERVQLVGAVSYTHLFLLTF